MGAGLETVDGMHAGQIQGIGRMSGDAGALPEGEVIHRSIPISPPSRCAALGRFESALFGLPGKPLT